MKIVSVLFFLAMVSCLLLAVGCEVQTEPQDPYASSPASTLVINEVFTLPLTNQNWHSWIELYNPTNSSINLSRWKLSFSSYRILQMSLTYWKANLQAESLRVTITTGFDSIAAHDIPFEGDSIALRTAGNPAITGYRIPSAPTVRSNEYATLVSDLNRLRVFRNLGSADGPTPASTPFFEIVFLEVTVPRDTSNPQLEIPDTVFSYQYPFFLLQSDQIVLKDPTGRVVDVVRFGNYTHMGPGADPYPGNRTLGVVPDYQSIARYAGGYYTGNTADDFYITGSNLEPNTSPLPHANSQAYKKK